MCTTIKPVILAGGSGTRLWPFSRQLHPKQFQSLHGKQTLLQNTIQRIEYLPNVSDTITVICNELHRFTVAEQLQEIRVKSDALILEPVGHNTAPALTLAALANKSAGYDDILLVMPADHVIDKTKEFKETLTQAKKLAEQNMLVTFGVVPTKAESAYGYIKQGKALDNFGYSIEQFVEKPNQKTAQKYFESGQFHWNSGIFMIKSSVWLEQVKIFSPEIMKACEKAFYNGKADLDFYWLEKNAFSTCPTDSIDYAVVEKMVIQSKTNAVMVSLDAGWSDIGAWSELWQIKDKDNEGNVIQGDVSIVNCENTMLLSTKRLIAGVGLKDMVVVETADAILVANRHQVQDVTKIVDWIIDEDRNEHLNHLRVYRPWGYFDNIDVDDRYQIKRITVNPGGVLSLQMHQFRAEHWIVINGTAKVTRGDESFVLTENQSTNIPIGTLHRLENTGSIPLEMLEIQSGSSFSEDDISRVEDIYSRL